MKNKNSPVTPPQSLHRSLRGDSGIRSDEADIPAQVRSVLRDEPGLRLALLYGSAVNGAMRADSDVDIAVLFDTPLSADRKTDLTLRLEHAVRRTVDLADLSSLSGTILKQILCNGQPLIRNKPDALPEMIIRMIYNQTDMMPYVRRVLNERQQRFAHG